MARKKLVLIVLDGLGDRPDAGIKNMTALERAKTPKMDMLAKGGRCGLMYPIGKNISPESDAAIYAIMGYDPFTEYTGRSAFEALGVGIKLGDDQLAMRGNFATVDEAGRIVDVRAKGLKDSDAERLVESISKVELSPHVEVLVRREEDYRFIVVFRSGRLWLSSNISNTHPGYIKPGTPFGMATEVRLGEPAKECVALDEEAEPTAGIVNEFARKAHAVLEKHPANRKKKNPVNYVLLRDAAKGLPKIKGLKEKYGLLWGAVTERILEKGVCSHIGMDIIGVKGEKSLAKDCKNKAKAALNDIDFYDCIYIYMKGPDTPSHKGDVKAKVRVIEKIDKHLVGRLVRGLDMEETVICITTDHATPCALRSHSDDPVPLLIYGAGSDSCSRFSEAECAKGSLGTIRGQELMDILVKTLNFKKGQG